MTDYDRNLVVAKVGKYFPNEDQSDVMAILDLYGRESYERERERVQIAILKLSNGDLGKLREHVLMAKRDYRDILAYAEYPEEMSQESWRLSEKEVERIREKDRQQYLDWLDG